MFPVSDCEEQVVRAASRVCRHDPSFDLDILVPVLELKQARRLLTVDGVVFRAWSGHLLDHG